MHTNQEPLAFIFTPEQAARLTARGLGTAAVAMTPAARARLQSHGLVAISSSDRYGEYAQRRVAARVRRLEKRLKLLNRFTFLAPAAYHQGVDLLLNMTLVAGRLWETIGINGPWLVPAGSDWLICHNRVSAFEALLPQALPDGGPQKISFKLPFLSWPHQLMRRWIFRRAANIQWMIAPRPRLPFGLLTYFSAQEQRGVCVIRPFNSLISELLGLRRTALSISKKRSFSVAVGLPSANDQRVVQEIDGFLEHINDPLATAIIRHGGISAQIIGFHRAAKDLVRIFDQLRPEATLSYQNNNQLALAISNAAIDSGVPQVMVQHNSLSFQPARNASQRYMIQMVCKSRFGRLPVDSYWAWSPVQHKAILETVARNHPETLHPFRLPEIAPKPRRPDDSRALVFYADNYMEWESHLPQLMQTSDELADSIDAAATAMSTLPHIDFKIRLKQKPELNKKVLAELLQFPDNVTVSDNSSSFEQELVEADMLVASMSTTIEQALQNRIPVLLYGYTDRYQHLPASRTVPSKTARSAIYVASNATEFALLTNAIIEAHHNHPLTDAELSGLVWSRNTPLLNESFARMMTPSRTRSRRKTS